MSKWERGQVIEKNKPEILITPPISFLECVYGQHKAELLHKGTAYCRACYDKKNLTSELIN